MALPLVALGAGLLRKTKIGKRAGKILGGLGKKVAGKVFKNNKSGRSAKVSSSPVMLATPATLATTLPDIKQSSILPKDWPKKVGEVLGEATKESREFTTSVDNKTLYTIGGIVLAAILLMKK